MSSIMELYARHAERVGLEMSVALLVRGVLVEGTLTSTAHYYQWVARVLEAAKTGGLPEATRVPAPRPTGEEAHEARQRWTAWVEAAMALDPEISEREAEARVVPKEVALRDARIVESDGNIVRAPYILIDTGSIDGVMLGSRTGT